MKASIMLWLLCLSVGALSAQHPNSLYKSAKKSLEKHQQGEPEQLDNAYQSIELMMPMIERLHADKSIKYWLKAGEVYNEVALGDYKQFLIYNTHQPKYPQASQKAADVLLAAISHADKKWDLKLAVDELLRTATFMTNEGIAAFNREDFETSYLAFQRVGEIQALLIEKGQQAKITNPSELFHHKYRTALAAKAASRFPEAIVLFELLEENKYNNPLVYQNLYEIYKIEGDSIKAIDILQNGRELFPDNTALLFVEINHHSTNGTLAPLERRLQEALAMDSRNAFIYIALGQVYDQMYQEDRLQGNWQSSEDNFNQSVYYYSRALDIKEEHADALYNLGVLYFNKSALLSSELVNLQQDRKASSIRLLMAKKAEMMTMLETALPYFERAIVVEPEDINTLKALQSIYTRLDKKEHLAEVNNRMKEIK